MKRLCLFIIIIVPIFCVAQTTITLDECISLAKENNKRIAAAHFQSEYAYYQRKSAFANFMPRVSITGTGIYSNVDGTIGVDLGMLIPTINLNYKLDWAYGAGVKVEQPIYMGGKIVSGYRMSKLGESMAVQNRRLTEAEIIVETAGAYASLVRAVEMNKVAVAYHDLLKELQRSVQKAASLGAKSKNDVLKVEVKLNESELNMHRADNAKQLALMNLSHYIGIPVSELTNISTELPEIDYNLTDVVDISNRPETRMLAQNSEVMHQQVNMARSEMLPQIGLVGQYGYVNGLRFNGTNLFDGWNYLAAVQLTIPIVRLDAYSKYHSAKMQYRQVQLEEEDKLEMMTLEVMQAANNLDESGLEVILAEKSVTSATENLRVSSSGYTHGVETLTAYLEAHMLWQQAEQQLIDARINRFFRWLEYCKATGVIN
jgi:outer membrane protein TolC